MRKELPYRPKEFPEFLTFRSAGQNFQPSLRLPRHIPRMITSKLTSKAQTTIPRAVRRHLGLQEGDVLGFVIEGSRVLLCKPANAAAAPPPVGRKLFAEWESEVDRRAYDGL